MGAIFFVLFLFLFVGMIYPLSAIIYRKSIKRSNESIKKILDDIGF